ncbi:GGDEF domain-containing protein [Marinicella litoralis]|uniref:GGDEF domain-containing protein n=1 Tax=Marinicella litoralis TaxID=644220 RepID=UPI001B870D21|nr:GGDEF domain-containing protein [Marinicella litoralis]
MYKGPLQSMQFLELDKYKKRVFQVLLALTIVSGTVFVFFNYQRGQSALALIEMAIVILSVGLMIRVNKIRNREKFLRIALVYLTFFLSVMMFAFSVEGVSITVFVWALGIPLISYLLLGVETGFIMTAIFYSLTASLFYRGFHAHVSMVDSIAYANFIACAFVFWGISHSYEHSNRFAKDRLNQLAVFDHLTGLYNRSMVTKLFTKAIESPNTHQQQISVISFDLDHFKNINDQYGHAIGDEVLQRFSQVLMEQIPAESSAFRMGGEEFVVILPTSNEAKANNLAEKIRKAIEQDLIISGLPKAFYVSVSVGVITDWVKSANLNSMLKAADQRLYQAKQQGRNVVVSHG